MRNDTITAGPASGTASCSTKKMPVPTVAPTPNIVSWNVPKLGLRSGPSWGPFFAAMGFLRVSCSPSVAVMALLPGNSNVAIRDGCGRSLDDPVAPFAQPGQHQLRVLLATGLELQLHLDLVEQEPRRDPLVHHLDHVGATRADLGEQPGQATGDVGDRDVQVEV